ncbi:hypothetical protein F4801DRAFT_443913 [Xylaria longipes]|nr:hypothetical protein F4801DRAFT_443913 [Xylaria longipes]
MCLHNRAITAFYRIYEMNALEDKVQQLEATAACAKWDSIDGWARKKPLVKRQFTYRTDPFAAHQSVAGIMNK